MRILASVFATVLLVCCCPIAASAATSLCKAAKASVTEDGATADAVAAVFGAVTFDSESSDCLYPLPVLRYASADVLLYQDGAPGEGCHGCGATLSASVVQRLNGGEKAVAKFREFASLGTSGTAGLIWPIEIGGDDGFVIASGGTFQGYQSTTLSFFAFQAGALKALEASDRILLEADNSGATAGSKAVTVTGSWFFDPADKASLVVDWKIQSKGATRVERAVWRLQGAQLVLTRGHVPPEVTAAAGG